MKKMIKLQEFKNYKILLEDFITNRAFRSRLLFETIDDERFATQITNYIDSLTDDIPASQLDQILSDIREKTIEYYEASKKAENSQAKLFLALRALAYFYFLESVDEHSTLSDNIIEQIKEKYPNDYLDIISKIDKVYLSVDTKKQISSDETSLDIKDELLKKYIILKQWQDSQHHFFEEGFGDYLEEIQYNYCKDPSLSSFDLEQVTLRKRLFDSLDEKKILDLETCSILTELYIKKFIVKYIGGKMYGLSVLNSKGIKVPYTLVIPTSVNVTSDDLDILNESISHYSIRSSADIEDGEKNSFAGMFDSYLNVPVEDILENINKVKHSVNNERLREYIKANSLEQPHMAVIIQAFKEPEYAGVWIGNSDASGVLEWVEGNGEKLVSGSSTPHTELWNENYCKNPLTLDGTTIGEKMLEYQELVGSNADFEWMILDNELVMLQFRPVTQKVIVSEEYKTQDKEDGYYGIPASPGTIEGEIRYLSSPDDEIVEDKILLAMMTDPDWLPHLMNSKGAITAYGGFLCHTAIVCRELGIPCVTGIGEDILEQLQAEENQSIELNGNTGKVKVIEKRKQK